MSRLLLAFLSTLGVAVGSGAWVVVEAVVVEFEVAIADSVSASRPGLSFVVVVVMSLEPARAEVDFDRSRGMVGLGKSG